MQAVDRLETTWAQFRKYGGLVTAAYLILYASWLFVGANSRTEQMVVGSLATFFPAAAAAYLTWWQLSLADSPRLRLAWSFLGAGVFLWAISDLFSLLVESGSPAANLITTIVNGCNLAGYLVLLVGVFIYPRQVRRGASYLRLLFDITISSGAVLVLGWEIIILPLINSAGEKGPFLASIYPVADLAMLVLLMNIFILTQPDRFHATLRWLTLGLVVFISSDLLFAYQSLHGQYHAGSLNDLGWVVGYCAIGLGALYFPQAVEGSLLKSSAPRGLARLELILEQGARTLLPLVGTVALGTYSLVDWSLRGQTDPIGMWMTVLLGLALVARQGVVTGEREQQRYAVLVNSIAEPAFICDRKGLLKLANPALLETLGYGLDSDALNDRPIQHLFASTSLPADLLETSLTSGWSGETLLCRKDGSTFPSYLSLRPIHHSGRERPTLAGTAHDLTLQKNQQAALQAAYEQIAAAHAQLETLNEQLEQKVEEKTRNLSEAYQILEQQNRALQVLDEVKSDFVSMVSHELRAPLTNISGGIELVLGSPQSLPPSTARSLALVQVEIRRLTHFVETILDLSALDAGRMPIYPAPMLLDDIVPHLRRQFEPVPGSERIRWEIPENLPLVLADEHALTSVFFHLIDNALKYAPQGIVTVQAPMIDSQYVYLQVVDEGPGISEEVLPMIFDKFYRVHRGDSQTVYGHGLGLYIVRRLLKAMDSDVQASNRPEGGACFTFWLNVIGEYDEREITAGG